MKRFVKTQSGKAFTATEISIALDIPRSRFFSCHPTPVRRVKRSYGTVLVFSVETLPDELRALLQFRQRRSTWSPREFISLEVQKERRAEIGKLLKRRLPPGPRAEAMRPILDLYIRHLDNGKPEVESNILARNLFLKRFRRNISAEQIRRRAAQVTKAGGPELAPLDAYADGKSVLHKRDRKAR